MNIYKHYHPDTNKVVSLSSPGHTDPVIFAKEANKLGIPINIGDVKLVWEVMKRNKRHIYFDRCSKHIGDAYPLTVARV